jgi:hypothetical protein
LLPCFYGKEVIMLSFLFLSQAVWANSVDFESEHIASVGAEVKWDMGGGWTRILPGEPESDFFYSAGGDYVRITMNADWEVDDINRNFLTGRMNLDDHNLVPCPSGGFLHVASGKTTEPNDSAYSFRYDEDFSATAQTVLAESIFKIRFNDMALICHEKGNFASFIDYDVWGTVVYTLDADGALLDEKRIPELPLAEGGVFLEDPVRGDLALVTSTPEKNGLFVNWLSWDLVFKDTRRILQVDRTVAQAYWPQAVNIIGDRIVLAYIQQPSNAGFQADWGNVWLAIFDLEWTLLENHLIVKDDGPDGTMRPGLALQGETLMLSYDEIEHFPPGVVQPRMVPITLKLSAFGDFGLPDTGGGSGSDSDSNTDSGGKGDDDDGGGVSPEWKCGCSSTESGRPRGVWVRAYWWLVLGLSSPEGQGQPRSLSRASSRPGKRLYQTAFNGEGCGSGCSQMVFPPRAIFRLV